MSMEGLLHTSFIPFVRVVRDIFLLRYCDRYHLPDFFLRLLVICMYESCWFLCAELYPATFLKGFICYRSFLRHSLGSLMYKIMSSINKDMLISAFPICIPMIYFSFLSVLIKLQILYWTDVERMGIVVFSMILVEMLWVLFCISSCSRTFIMKGCCMLSKALYVSNEMMVFLFFQSVYVVEFIDWFTYIEPSLHCWDEAFLIMVYVLGVLIIWREPMTRRTLFF